MISNLISVWKVLSPDQNGEHADYLFDWEVQRRREAGFIIG